MRLSAALDHHEILYLIDLFAQWRQEGGSSQASAALPKAENETIFAILFAASFSHLLNDTIQSLIPAVYPVLKESFQLNFTQIGLITLTFQITASMLQPVAA
ncbi:MAG TPA: hypothetical protein VK673_01945 [Chthoniobacterales bacterium]|nr:hypothetical protein [Chthoniobacterales bacterium]